MLDVITAGEAMVLLVATQTGLLRHAHTFERFIGGAELNVAIGLARLGHTAGWISRVGQDEFGESMLALARGEGVDISQVKVDPEAPTGVYFKERRTPTLTRVYYYRRGSAASRLSPKDLDPGYFRQARWLHLTGITPALSDSCREACRRALDLAGEAGLPVSLDVNLRKKLWSPDEARQELGEWIPRCRVVFASQEEAAWLTGEADPEKAAGRLVASGAGLAVVKLGAAGALACTPAGETVSGRGEPVQVVDPIGAGDAFDAGFLSGLLRGWDLPACLRLGNYLGGLATASLGDIEALPTRGEAEEFLARIQPLDR